MASGLPVIVTNVGDNQIWIQDDENGFIIPPRNPEQLLKRYSVWCVIPKSGISGGEKPVLVEEKQDYYKEMEKVHILYTNLVKR